MSTAAIKSVSASTSSTTNSKNTLTLSTKPNKSLTSTQNKALSPGHTSKTPLGRSKNQRRHSLDMPSASTKVRQSSSFSSANATDGGVNDCSASSIEPKSILKQGKPRRNSIAFGHIPHSAEYKLIMSAFLSAKTPGDLPSQRSTSRGRRGSKTEDNASSGTYDEETASDDDESDAHSLTFDAAKDDNSAKKVTFNDDVVCAIGI